MKFGIFYELQLPRPWEQDSELKLYQNALDQIELADKLGYDYAWEVEHHFLEEYSHSPSPESFLAAASQRTKQIRLGHGIYQLTTNHPPASPSESPVSTCCRTAAANSAWAKAPPQTELEPFGRDMESSARCSRRPCRPSCRCSRTAAASITANISTCRCATCCRSRIRSRIRRCGSPARSSTRWKCGEWGIGALGFQFVSADAAHAWVHAYYNAFTKRQKKLADYQTNPNIALVSFFMCAKTDEEARERADGETFFQFSLKYYGASSGRQRPAPGTVNMWDEYNKWKKANPEAHAAALARRPDRIAGHHPQEAAQVPVQSNIDQVVLLNQAGKNTHEHICESLELFGKEVMPEFHDAHPQLLKWKEQVLNREIELEEIDTTAFKERYGGNMKNINAGGAKVQAAE
jgi:alkanesulfonate monooxygenase SsuD/methylene tetrahydromethanopterin reductase-like flavin-dependent oxidoreductase (luciferase family)